VRRGCHGAASSCFNPRSSPSNSAILMVLRVRGMLPLISPRHERIGGDPDWRLPTAGVHQSCVPVFQQTRITSAAYASHPALQVRNVIVQMLFQRLPRRVPNHACAPPPPCSFASTLSRCSYRTARCGRCGTCRTPSQWSARIGTAEDREKPSSGQGAQKLTTAHLPSDPRP
jgi:hypothetical protein